MKGIAAWRLRGDRPALALHLLAAACVAGMLLAFALGNNPINAQFAAWTPATLPPDWATLRDRWEAYHATSAALATATLRHGARAARPHRGRDGRDAGEIRATRPPSRRHSGDV